MDFTTKKHPNVFALIAFLSLIASNVAFSSEKHSSSKSRDELKSSLESSFKGDVQPVTFNEIDSINQRVVSKKMSVSKLTASAMTGNFETLKENAKIINSMRSDKASTLCEQMATGIILAQRFDLLEDMMNFLQQEHPTAEPLQGTYKRFLKSFVTSFWMQLLHKGSESLLKQAHEGHYLPMQILPGVIELILHRYGQSADAYALLQNIIERYHSFEPHAPHNIPYRKVDVLNILKGLVPDEALVQMFHDVKSWRENGSDLHLTRDASSAKKSTLQPLAVMMAEGVSDGCIIQCLRHSKLGPFTRVGGENLSSARILIEYGRFPLFFSLLTSYGSQWLSDKEEIVDLLLKRKDFFQIDRLMNEKAFYKTKASQESYIDQIISSLKGSRIEAAELKKILQARTQPFVQSLMVRAMQTNDSEAMLYLLSTKLVDLNHTEIALK